MAHPVDFTFRNFFFFNLSQIILGSTGPIFTIFSLNERYLREFSRSGQGNRFWAKFTKRPLFNTNTLAFRSGFKYRNSDLQVLKGTIFATSTSQDVVCGNFFLLNPYLQAGLTNLDKIWHDGMSQGVASPKMFW